MFSKKFRVRVKYFGDGYYQVQYAHYRFVPLWHSLQYFCSPYGFTYQPIKLWFTELRKVKHAEDLADSLKTITDVVQWYKPHREKEKDYYARRSQYYKNSVPYTTKNL